MTVNNNKAVFIYYINQGLLLTKMFIFIKDGRKNTMVKNITIDRDDSFNTREKQILEREKDLALREKELASREAEFNKMMRSCLIDLENELLICDKLEMRFLRGIRENERLADLIKDHLERQKYIKSNQINMRRFDNTSLQKTLWEIQKKSGDNDSSDNTKTNECPKDEEFQL